MTDIISFDRRVLYPLVAAAMLLALWELFALAVATPAELPTASAVLSELLSRPQFYLYHAGITFLEALTGFIIAVCVSLLLAMTFALFEPVRAGFLPLVIAAQAIPIVAIAPLLIRWLGDGFLSKAVMAALLCWFPTVINATRGMTRVSPRLNSLFKVYNASRRDRLFKLQVPNSVAFIVSGIRISAGLAMIGALVAEYGGAKEGLGAIVIHQSIERSDVNQLFAAIVCAALAGLALAELAYRGSRVLLSRYASAEPL